VTDVEAFLMHDRATAAFTEALRDGRCRKTARFSRDIGETVGVLGPLVGPWNLEALFVLYMEGPRRFSAVKRALPGVSSRVLTDKLRHLERHALVARTVEGAAVTYALTLRGEIVARHLHPIVFFLRNPELAPQTADRVPA
jgi:DNA-binding HxlR family transcriptional regulator